MSAIVCGKRSSSFFEELQYNHTSPPPSAAVVSKRIRCSTSPIRLSPPRNPSLLTSPTLADNSRNSRNRTSHLAHLRSLFPDMDEQLLERALEASGDDLDSAIKSLTGLCLGSTEGTMDSSASRSIAEINTNIQLPPEGMDGAETHSNLQDCNLTNIMANYGGNTSSQDPSANLPADGSEWVEVFVREMLNASDMDDARARASRVLEVLEKSIMARASAEAEQTFHKEYLMLKEQVEGLLRDNTILKRAVSIQHERQKEHDERNHELKHLKQMVSQYQEQLRTLEVNNYALTVHLRQAQQSSSIPGRFHPDVF